MCGVWQHSLRAFSLGLASWLDLGPALSLWTSPVGLSQTLISASGPDSTLPSQCPSFCSARSLHPPALLSPGPTHLLFWYQATTAAPSTNPGAEREKVSFLTCKIDGWNIKVRHFCCGSMISGCSAQLMKWTREWTVAIMGILHSHSGFTSQSCHRSKWIWLYLYWCHYFQKCFQHFIIASVLVFIGSYYCSFMNTSNYDICSI